MKKIVLLAVASLLLVSCSNEDTISSLLHNRELNVFASIKSAQKTRSLMNTFAADDQIGIFVTGTSYTPKAAVYTLASGAWTPPSASNSKIQLGVDDAVVYGFYPATLQPTTYFSNQENNQVNINIPTSFTGLRGEGQTDFMYSNHPKVTSNAPSTELVFSHALCKLSFVVNAGWGYVDSKSIVGFKITKEASFKCGDGAMNVNDGTILWDSNASSTKTFAFTGTATMSDYNSADPSSQPTTTVLECLMAPNADNSDVSITLTINGADKSVKLPQLNGADKWLAGNNYKYTITVYGSSLVINPAQIVDWVDEDIPDSDLKLNQ